MMKISKTIVFFGTDESSLVTLKQLVEAGNNIGAVITKPDRKSGRGQKISAPNVKIFAQQNNIPVWQPAKIADCNENIKSLGDDIIGILVCFGKIIPQSTIDLFRNGIINLHPSLLPKYRGPSPIESAIENGDEITGVSIMELSAEMDAGPVYKQTFHKLNGNETRPELYEQLFSEGTDELLNILPSIFDGSIRPVAQDENQASLCSLFSKEDAWLRPDEISASEAERLVRAHLDFPKTKYSISGHDIVITKSHVTDRKLSLLDIECNDEKYLSIDELIAPSGRKMTARDFINGYL